MSRVTDQEVEAACQAAHDVLMRRRPTRLREPWESVPASERVEWREEQRAALEAAAAGRESAEPSVPLSAVAEVLTQLRDGHYLATEAASASGYASGCRDAYSSAIGLLQRAFPQLTEEAA